MVWGGSLEVRCNAIVKEGHFDQIPIRQGKCGRFFGTQDGSIGVHGHGKIDQGTVNQHWGHSQQGIEWNDRLVEEGIDDKGGLQSFSRVVHDLHSLGASHGVCQIVGICKDVCGFTNGAIWHSEREVTSIWQELKQYISMVIPSNFRILQPAGCVILPFPSWIWMEMWGENYTKNTVTKKLDLQDTYAWHSTDHTQLHTWLC